MSIVSRKVVADEKSPRQTNKHLCHLRLRVCRSVVYVLCCSS